MKHDGTMSTEEVAAYAGITTRSLYHWIEKGWLGAPAPRTGPRRPTLRWTERQAARVLSHHRLMEAGLSGEAAAEVLSQSSRGGWLSDHVKVSVKP